MQGLLHHRGFGSACHLGVAVGIPTIGISKNPLQVDGLTVDRIRALIAAPTEDSGTPSAEGVCCSDVNRCTRDSIHYSFIMHSFIHSRLALLVAAGWGWAPGRTKAQLVGESGTVWGAALKPPGYKHTVVLVIEH